MGMGADTAYMASESDDRHGGDAPREEIDFDPTWEAIETAREALLEVRAVHLSNDQHEDIREMAVTLENIQQSIDSQVDAMRGEE